MYFNNYNASYHTPNKVAGRLLLACRLTGFVGYVMEDWNLGLLKEAGAWNRN